MIPADVRKNQPYSSETFLRRKPKTCIILLLQDAPRWQKLCVTLLQEWCLPCTSLIWLTWPILASCILSPYLISRTCVLMSNRGDAPWPLSSPSAPQAPQAVRVVRAVLSIDSTPFPVRSQALPTNPTIRSIMILCLALADYAFKEKNLFHHHLSKFFWVCPGLG